MTVFSQVARLPQPLTLVIKFLSKIIQQLTADGMIGKLKFRPGLTSRLLDLIAVFISVIRNLLVTTTLYNYVKAFREKMVVLILIGKNLLLIVLFVSSFTVVYDRVLIAVPR